MNKSTRWEGIYLWNVPLLHPWKCLTKKNLNNWIQVGGMGRIQKTFQLSPSNINASWPASLIEVWTWSNVSCHISQIIKDQIINWFTFGEGQIMNNPEWFYGDNTQWGSNEIRTSWAWKWASNRTNGKVRGNILMEKIMLRTGWQIVEIPEAYGEKHVGSWIPSKNLLPRNHNPGVLALSVLYTLETKAYMAQG